MLKNWGAWFGTDTEVKEENCSVINDNNKHDINKAPAHVEEDADPPQLLQKAKGLSGESETVQFIAGRLFLKNILDYISMFNFERCLELFS